jgi:UDP-glucose 4-epimerase
MTLSYAAQFVGLGRCLVTGATGFIGTYLVKELGRIGVHVRAVHRAGGDIPLGVSADWVQADTLDPIAIENACRDVTTIFHLAGSGSPTSDPTLDEEILQTNIIGTHNVLRAARSTGVRRVVTASSAAIYGRTDSGAIGESVPPMPTTTYGFSKLADEQLCSMYASEHGLQTVALRLFNAYGGSDRKDTEDTKLIPSVTRLLHEGRSIPIYGHGDQVRDFVHVKDVVSAFLMAGKADLTGHYAINIGSGKGVSILDVVNTIASVLSVTPQLEFLPVRPGETIASVADVTFAAELLGFEASISFRKGIQEMLNRVGAS